MISIAYQDLVLTVIGLALVAIAGSVVWFALRASRTLERYERLVPALEQVGFRGQEALAQLEAIVLELRQALHAASDAQEDASDNGVSPIGLVRNLKQLSAFGTGLKAAIDSFQSTRRSHRVSGDR